MYFIYFICCISEELWLNCWIKANMLMILSKVLSIIDTRKVSLSILTAQTTLGIVLAVLLVATASCINEYRAHKYCHLLAQVFMRLWMKYRSRNVRRVSICKKTSQVLACYRLASVPCLGLNTWYLVASRQVFPSHSECKRISETAKIENNVANIYFITELFCWTAAKSTVACSRWTNNNVSTS